MTKKQWIARIRAAADLGALLALHREAEAGGHGLTTDDARAVGAVFNARMQELSTPEAVAQFKAARRAKDSQ